MLSDIDVQRAIKEGLGVLSDIDVQRAIKEGLGTDILPYRILGA